MLGFRLPAYETSTDAPGVLVLLTLSSDLNAARTGVVLSHGSPHWRLDEVWALGGSDNDGERRVPR